jgi:hypothetical protein
LQTLAAISLTTAILSFLSPQVGQLGHGLRTTLPSLVVAWFAIHQISSRAFISAFMRFRVAFVFGFIFLVQASVRFAYADNAMELWHTFFWGPLLALAFLLWIGAYAELGGDAVRQFRRLLLFGWCISLAVGLPSLLENPGVARTTMGNEFASENAAIWAPYGVGEYSVYTTAAICLVPLFSIAYRLRGGVRWLGLFLLCVVASAVILSTFTMASLLLLLSVFGLLLGWVRMARGWSRLWRSVFACCVVALLLFLYSFASSIPQSNAIILKADRLFTGILTTGLARGDETGRGSMFVDEMETFANEPFLGFLPHIAGKTGYGHSSLSNSLVLFGFFGAALWVVALWSVFKSCLCHADTLLERDALYFSWLALFFGGILNPMWHITATLGGLFALTLPATQKRHECDRYDRRLKFVTSASSKAGGQVGDDAGARMNLNDIARRRN